MDIFVRKRTQYYSINHTEHGCCRANAQGQRQNSRDGEARTLPQLPQCVANILKQTVHEYFLTRTAMPPWDPPLPLAAPECSKPPAPPSPASAKLQQKSEDQWPTLGITGWPSAVSVQWLLRSRLRLRSIQVVSPGQESDAKRPRVVHLR